MSVFSLIYPSPSLARFADPLKLAARSAREGRTLELEEAVSLATDRIGKELRTVIPRKFDADASPDERWYWLAPLLLDAKDPEIRSDEWLARRGEPGSGARAPPPPSIRTAAPTKPTVCAPRGGVPRTGYGIGPQETRASSRRPVSSLSPGLPSRHQLSAPSDPWHARPVRQQLHRLLPP